MTVVFFGNRVFADNPVKARPFWIRVGPKSYTTGVIIRTDTDTWEDCPRTIEAEILVIHLAAKECQGLQAHPRNREGTE